MSSHNKVIALTSPQFRHRIVPKKSVSPGPVLGQLASVGGPGVLEEGCLFVGMVQCGKNKQAYNLEGILVGKVPSLRSGGNSTKTNREQLVE